MRKNIPRSKALASRILVITVAAASMMLVAPSASAHECDNIAANSEDAAEIQWTGSGGELLRACAGVSWTYPYSYQAYAEGEHSSDVGGEGFVDVNNDIPAFSDTCTMPNGASLNYCTTRTQFTNDDCVAARAWTNTPVNYVYTDWVDNKYC